MREPENHLIECRHVADRLVAYLEDGLDSAEHAAVAAHIAACAHCTESVRAWTTLENELQRAAALSPPRLSADAALRLRRSTRRRLGLRDDRPGDRIMTHITRYTYTALGLVAAVVLLGVLWNTFSNPVPPESAVSAPLTPSATPAAVPVQSPSTATATAEPVQGAPTVTATPPPVVTDQPAPVTVAPPVAEPLPEAVADWLAAGAQPLASADPDADSADLEPLRALVGDARIVALGEAVYGSSDAVALNHRIVAFLVQEMGFNVVALESGWHLGLNVNAYVHGADIDEVDLVQAAFDRNAMLDLIDWLRDYRAASGTSLLVGGLGALPLDPQRAVTAFNTAVSAADPAAPAVYADDLACVEPVLNDLLSGTAASDVRDACAAALQRAIDRLVAAETTLAPAAPQEYAQALHGLRVLHGVIDDFGRINRDGSRMAANAAWLLEQAGPDARLIILAHNLHIAGTGSVLGGELRRQYGDDYVAIGHLFGQGRFNANAWRSDGIQGLQRHSVEPVPGTLDHALSTVAGDRYLLDLRTGRDVPEVADWLATPLPSRQIRFAYQPDCPPAAFLNVTPGSWFDGVVFSAAIDAATTRYGGAVSARGVPPVLDAAFGLANLSFESGLACWVQTGRAADYAVAVDPQQAVDGSRSVRLASQGAWAADDQTWLWQSAAAGAWAGQRVRVTAYLRTAAVADRAYLTVDTSSLDAVYSAWQTAYDDAALTGDNEWTELSVVVDVADNAAVLVVGVALHGTGQVWLDGIRLEAVGPDVPLSPVAPPPGP